MCVRVCVCVCVFVCACVCVGLRILMHVRAHLCLCVCVCVCVCGGGGGGLCRNRAVVGTVSFLWKHCGFNAQRVRSHSYSPISLCFGGYKQLNCGEND